MQLLAWFSGGALAKGAGSQALCFDLHLSLSCHLEHGWEGHKQPSYNQDNSEEETMKATR